MVVNRCDPKTFNEKNIEKTQCIYINGRGCACGKFFDATSLRLRGTNEGKPIQTARVRGETFSRMLNHCSVTYDFVCLVHLQAAIYHVVLALQLWR